MRCDDGAVGGDQARSDVGLLGRVFCVRLRSRGGVSAAKGQKFIVSKRNDAAAVVRHSARRVRDSLVSHDSDTLASWPTGGEAIDEWTRECHGARRNASRRRSTPPQSRRRSRRDVRQGRTIHSLQWDRRGGGRGGTRPAPRTPVEPPLERLRVVRVPGPRRRGLRV